MPDPAGIGPFRDLGLRDQFGLDEMESIATICARLDAGERCAWSWQGLQARREVFQLSIGEPRLSQSAAAMLDVRRLEIYSEVRFDVVWIIRQAHMEAISVDNVRLAFDGELACITLADPERLNAVSTAMAEGVMRALQEASKPRRSVRAVYLTGEGRGFCAGANLAGRGADASGNLPVLSRAEAVYHPLIRRLREFERPIVVGVNGACVGIGLAMALQADHIVASESAYFSTPFAKLGSSPDGGLTWALPRIVGPMRARRMLMRLERITAAEAKDWGLVSEVLPAEGFKEAALAVAQIFAAGPTVALSEIRRLLIDAGRVDFDSHLEAEARALARAFRSKDNQAGMKAFASKTAPVFTGE